MKIESLSELKKLLKLCHEQGVYLIEIDGIKMQLQEPAKSTAEAATALQTEVQYTDEELMTWSSAGHDGTQDNQS